MIVTHHAIAVIESHFASHARNRADIANLEDTPRDKNTLHHVPAGFMRSHSPMFWSAPWRFQLN